jgi:hypothetical protein
VYATRANGEPAEDADGSPTAAAPSIAVAVSILASGASSVLSGISPTLASAAALLVRDLLGLWTSSSGSTVSSGRTGIGVPSLSSGFLSDYHAAFGSASSVDGEDGSDGTGGSDHDSQGTCGSPVSDSEGGDADLTEHVPPQMPTVEPSSGAAIRDGGEIPLNRELEYHFLNG